jgi:hypothetical protein
MVKWPGSSHPDAKASSAFSNLPTAPQFTHCIRYGKGSVLMWRALPSRSPKGLILALVLARERLAVAELLAVAG